MRLGERRLFHPTDHPDNREEFRVIGFARVRDFLADHAAVRIPFAGLRDFLTEHAAVGKIMARKIFINDTDSFRPVRILGGQKPSFAQRNAERGEVIAGDGIGVMTLQRLARRRHIALRRGSRFAVIASQRHVRDDSGSGHTRLLADQFQQAIAHLNVALRIALPRDRQLAGKNVIGLEARRDSHDFFQAQSEQGSAGQENERERDLRDDEAVAETLRRATDRPVARLGLKRVTEMTGQVEPRNRQSDDDAENKRAASPAGGGWAPGNGRTRPHRPAGASARCRAVGGRGGTAVARSETPAPDGNVWEGKDCGGMFAGTGGPKNDRCLSPRLGENRRRRGGDRTGGG